MLPPPPPTEAHHGVGRIRVAHWVVEDGLVFNVRKARNEFAAELAQDVRTAGMGEGRVEGLGGWVLGRASLAGRFLID